MNKKQLKQAFEEGLIDEQAYKNKLFALETAPREKRRKNLLPKSVKQEEFVEIIKKLPSTKRWRETKVAFLLAYESGLRVSEIKNLRKDDIDVKQKSILVREAKFSKDRIVPLPKTWRSWMIEFIPIKKSVRSLERNFKTALKNSKIGKDYVFHSLRHSFATRSIERGIPINQIQLLMGHSNISATNVYLRARPTDALKSYEEFF